MCHHSYKGVATVLVGVVPCIKKFSGPLYQRLPKLKFSRSAPMSCFRHPFLFLGLRILIQPKNVDCKPGDKLKFSIETSKTAQAYQWHLNGKEISDEDKDYEGSTTNVLSINKCLPKHKGSYNCIIMTELDTSLNTEIAVLKIGV